MAEPSKPSPPASQSPLSSVLPAHQESMTGGNAPRHPHIDKFFSSTVPKYLNIIVLLLSFGLLAFISWDTIKNLNFLDNPIYMKYQFIVCMVFLAEYVYRFFITKNKVQFFIFTLPYLFISLPYLNLFSYYHYNVDPEILYYLRFVPIARGLVALIVVVNFLSESIATTVCMSYIIVLVPLIYMGGLIFYVAERHINHDVTNFWLALWWAGMDVTTIGSYINPLTVTGKVVGLVLSLLGIIMFPLFTVYFGDVIQTLNKKNQKKQ